MVKIRQHGENKQLFDIASFIPFLEERINILQWKISIDWCTGENSLEIEKSAETPWIGSHLEFKKIYGNIFQTIDGEFQITASEGKVKMLAFDSSYWEIESDIPELESIFLSTFGEYVGYIAQPLH